MDHRQELEILVELAQLGNMRSAAGALRISQSTLSDRLNAIEANYGAPLFERDRRGSRPTVYGEVVVAAAIRALSIMDEAQREIGLIKGSASGRLVIGAEPGLIEPFLAPAIALGLQRYPGLRFRLHALDSTSLVDEVREKRIDFFFGIQPDGVSQGLNLREIGTAQVVPFVRPGHPLISARRRRLSEIMRYPAVHGPGPRWLIRQIAAELRPNSSGGAASGDAAVIVNDFGVVRAIVAQSDAVGLGVSVLMARQLGSGELVELKLPTHQANLFKLPMFLGTAEDRALPPAAQTLIVELEKTVAGLAPTR